MGKKLEDYLVKLNEADNKILLSYRALCECLGVSLGKAYEIVVHSLGVGDKFILKIVNGDYSGRSEEDEIDSLSVVLLEQLYALVKQGDPPVVVCFSTGENGSLVRSSSIGIIGSGRKLIGMICLNFYLDTPFSKIIENFALPGFLTAGNSQLHAYGNNGYDMTLYETINNAKNSVMNNPDIPSKLKRKEIIRILNEIGVFNVKKGVSTCAEMLGITITTIYMHIRHLDATTEKSE